MSQDLIYGCDDKPPLLETIGLGFQHYLTMFGAAVGVPLILAPALGMDDPAQVAVLIGTAFFASGVATLLQTTLGNRLPLVQGPSFSLLAPALALCGSAALQQADWDVRLQHVQGAILVGAVVEIAVGYSGLMGRLLRFIGPLTIAPTIALIGLSLFEIGAPKAGKDWFIGGLTILLIVLFSQYLRRWHRALQLYPILLAVLTAWGVAWLLSALGVYADQSTDEAGKAVAAHPSFVGGAVVASAPWFRPPTPFPWGWPTFVPAAIIGMLAGYVASMVESVGDYYACARLSGAPQPDARTVNRGIGMEGVGCLVAGVLGTGNGLTSYSENIGAIGLTRVGSRRVVQAGAVLMLLLAMLGKFGALFSTIPEPVVGGMYCAVFGMIAAVGLSNLQFVDLNSPRNLFILGFSFFMGLSVPEYFRGLSDGLQWGAHWQWAADILTTLGRTGMAVGALIALVLDNTIPGTDQERGIGRLGGA